MKKSNLVLFLAAILFSISISNCDYEPYSQGATLYKVYCSNCHMENGEGLRGLIPPLASTDYLKDNQEALPCIIKKGIKGEITVNGRIYDTEMVGIQTLNDVQVNNIINYINHAWGNDYGLSNVKEVARSLDACGAEY